MERPVLKRSLRRATASLIGFAILQCLAAAGAAVVDPCPAAALAVVPAALPSGVVGMEYDQAISGTNGSGPTTFASTSGGLSGGVNLSGSRTYAVLACGLIDVAPSTLPGGLAGSAYSQTLTASGGQPPYTFAVSLGSLPPGLTLSEGGAISGSLATAGTFNFTITASDVNGCTGNRAYTIVVSCPAITVAPASLPAAVEATAYAQTVTASGGTAPYTFAVTSGALPAGLTLSSSGALTGSPTVVGTFNFVVTATDTHGCTGTASYSLTVTCAVIGISPTALPAAKTGTAYSAVLTGSGGVGPYTFAVTSGATPPGVTLAPNGNLSGTPTSLGTFTFIVLATDANGCTGSQGYSITVSCGTITLSPATLPGGTVGVPYSQTITATGGTAPYAFSFVSGSLPPGITLSGTGLLAGTPTAAGTFNFTVRAADANACLGTRSYSIVAVCPAITLAPTTLPAGTVGAAYSQTITASGGTGPYSFAVTSGSLTPGLTLSPGGALTGTPTAAGTFTFAVTATDADGCSGTQSYSITTACPAMTLSPATLPAPTVSVPYSQAITASGGVPPFSFTVASGVLPTGLALSPSGVLSGTPTSAGSFTFTVAVTDVNGCSGSRGYSVVVGVAPCPTIALSPTTLPGGTAGTAYSQVITASGGTGPYTFTISSGLLPAGLTLSASGVLTGTPTAVGVFTFFVTARDRNSCSGTAQYTLTISTNSPTLTALNPGAAATGGPAFTLQVTGSGFVAGSTILWNGSPRPTTFVSSTELTGSIPASDIAASGSASVSVVNPGGATSNALTFTISSGCQPPQAPQNPTIVPNDNPTGPVTGIDFLRLTWNPPASGPAPSGYEWALNGDPFTSAGTATSVVVGPRGNNDPIQLHVRATGCSPGPTADSPVYSPAPPTAAFSTPGPAAVGSPVTFTDTSDPQATSWLWLFGDGQIATTQSATHAFTAAGTYSVVLVASNGAGSSMVIHSQVVQAATSSGERPASSRAFDPSEPGRQWIRELKLTGPRRTWLHAIAPGSEKETVVYLRFYDAKGRLVLERRLSVSPGQEAIYDIGTFRLRGVWSVEAVSARPVELEVLETDPPEPAKRRDP